jgi:DNA-binding transcriptional MocR family regulator
VSIGIELRSNSTDFLFRVGQNPTSGTLSLARRKEIYAVCQKYDVVIVEDDPYWYLQYPSSTSTDQKYTATGNAFLDSLVPSYLHVDTDGRVVRLDTFSKTVAPGCRLGWVTAQPAVIERLLRITESSTQQPSGFVQSMVAQLLIGKASSASSDTTGSAKPNNIAESKAWAMEGWARWLEGLRGEYERRMNSMCDVLEEGSKKVISHRRMSVRRLMAAHTIGENNQSASAVAYHQPPETVDDWSVVDTVPIYCFQRPMGGMFLWVHFHFATHPLAWKVRHDRLSQALWVLWTQDPYKVLVAPGGTFSPTPEILEEDGWKYVRICFAAAPVEDIIKLSERFAAGARAFWDIRKVEVIDELLKDMDGHEPALHDMSQFSSLVGFC